MITLLLLVRATYIYMGVVLHAHPVRGESHNQRNTTGDVATLHASMLSCDTGKNGKSRGAWREVILKKIVFAVEQWFRLFLFFSFTFMNGQFSVCKLLASCFVLITAQITIKHLIASRANDQAQWSRSPGIVALSEKSAVVSA